VVFIVTILDMYADLVSGHGLQGDWDWVGQIWAFDGCRNTFLETSVLSTHDDGLSVQLLYYWLHFRRTIISRATC